MNALAKITALLRGDVAADKVVPPSGLIAQLTVFATAAMAFLAVLAIVLSVAAQRVADRWADALDRVSTIELSGGDDAGVAQLLSILDTTPGVVSAMEIDAARQKELLAPWLGPDFPIDTLVLPRLVELRESGDLDREGLGLRLQGELPDALYQPHSEQQRQIASSALRLRLMGWVALVITGLVMAVIITLAASTALAANAGEIATLRLIGARDDFIARAFVRRFTMRGAIGAAIGTVVGVLILLIIVFSGVEVIAPLVPGFGGWLLIFLITPLAGAIAFMATRAAANRVLSRLT